MIRDVISIGDGIVIYAMPTFIFLLEDDSYYFAVAEIS